MKETSLVPTRLTDKGMLRNIEEDNKREREKDCATICSVIIIIPLAPDGGGNKRKGTPLFGKKR